MYRVPPSDFLIAAQYQQRASKAFAAAASQRGLKPQRLAVKLELLLHAVEPLALVQYVLALEAFADDFALGGGARPATQSHAAPLREKSAGKKRTHLVLAALEQD